MHILPSSGLALSEGINLHSFSLIVFLGCFKLTKLAYFGPQTLELVYRKLAIQKFKHRIARRSSKGGMNQQLHISMSSMSSSLGPAQ